jgi:transcriptional regulator
MYLPATFVATNGEATALIGAHPLAQLVVHGPDGLVATPVPLIGRANSLVGHLTKANPLCGHGGAALAIFAGPDAYVSPGLYPTKAETGKVVPTWNYETVQVRGTLVFHDDSEWKLGLVSELTNHFERDRAQPWRVTDAPADYIGKLLNSIIGIELVDLTIVAKRKLSQNRPDQDRLAVESAFSNGSRAEKAVAEAMQRPTPH